jgi:hypothetical protein
VLNEQHDAYIINDRDGFTNIRKEPDASSQIVGKVYKHQLFWSIGNDYCGSGMFSTDNREAVESYENPNGYIYRKNILPVEELPVIEGKGIFKL